MNLWTHDADGHEGRMATLKGRALDFLPLTPAVFDILLALSDSDDTDMASRRKSPIAPMAAFASAQARSTAR